MDILVWHGKHGDMYYDASTLEAKETSARKILEEWCGYWVPEPEDPMKHIQYSGIDIEQANLTDEQIAGLPTETLQQEASKHKDRLARRLRRYEEDVREYELMKRIINGETVMEVRVEKSKVSEARWQKLLETREQQEKRHPGIVYEDERILIPVTAWSLVQRYGDGEYMSVTLESVETAGAR